MPLSKIMDKKENLNPRWLRKDASIDQPMHVSIRGYREVMDGLGFPDEYFYRGEKVLSIGEGLSDFAANLNSRGVKVVPMDPIYGFGNKLFNPDIEKTREIISDTFQGRVMVYDWRRDRKEILNLKKTERMVAGSVYEMPFKNQSFSYVVGHRIVEHIGLAEALPELLRVLKQGGEIRLGGVLVQASVEKMKLFLGNNYYDGGSGQRYFVPFQGFKETLELISKYHGLNVYTVLNGLPKRSEIRDEMKLYQAGLLIIRHDDKIPVVSGISDDEIKITFSGLKSVEYPFLGKMFKINVGSFSENRCPGKECYSLKKI